MRLYLMRHGDALAAAEAGTSDAERPLSRKGRADAEKAARHLAASGGKPALLLVSPLLRARQTAELALGALRPPPRLEIYEPLDNRVSGIELARRVLSGDFACPEMLLIGHQPQLGELAAYLAGESLDLPPGGLLAFDAPAGGSAAGSKPVLLWSKYPSRL